MNLLDRAAASDEVAVWLWVVTFLVAAVAMRALGWL